MKGLIIAAGKGSRIRGDDKSSPPKPLSLLLGKPLIEWVIKGFTSAGIKEIIIVIGFKGELIKKEIGNGDKFRIKIKYVYNEDYHLPLGHSVLSAKKEINEENFILSMSDHIVSPNAIKRMVNSPQRGDSCELLTDIKFNNIFWIDDAAKVKLEGKNILEISKELKQYDAIDCGVFKCTPIVFPLLEKLKNSGKCSMSEAATSLGKEGKMRSFDIEKDIWIDIDEKEELIAAEKMFKNILI
jgi:choline kinase